jgi:hypothetical protein
MLDFPIQIPGTGLTAESLVCYDGPFLESDNREEVQGVTALLVRNNGKIGAVGGEIKLYQADRLLTFSFTQLPPGAAVLVLERSGQVYLREKVSGCGGNVRYSVSGWNPEDNFTFRELPPGGLTITNTQNRAVKDVRLYYKSAYPEGGFCLGGQTWELLVGAMEAGETLCLYPEHYCCGVSQILRVTSE